MKRTLLLAAILLLSPAASASDWNFLAKKDGVSTWSQSVPGTKLLGFRGEAHLDVSATDLVSTMLSPEKVSDWVDLLSEHRVVDGGNTQVQVIYQRYATPWPIADRDYVIERRVTQHPELGRTTVTMRSTTHPGAPEVQGVVRAYVSQSYFSFTSLPDGSTQVEVEAFTDPKGAVPMWLVNLVQKNWARNSINALARIATRERADPPSP